MSKRTHSLEGREECIHELENVARGKMGTHLLEGRKREEWVGELRNMAWCKMRTHLLEGRKWEKWVGELRNMAHCNLQVRTHLRGGKGRSGLESLEMWHVANENAPIG